MKIIANVNKERGIGRDGGLLVNIPEDMKSFRLKTAGSVLIMGRKTLESFPGEKPLKGRINIVLTRDPSRISVKSRAAADAFFIYGRGIGYGGTAEFPFDRIRTIAAENLGKAAIGSETKAPGYKTILIAASTRADVLSIIDRICPDGTDHVFVIGGASVYELFLDDCDTCLVTENNADLRADTFFPDITNSGWRCDYKGETREYEGIAFSFNRYVKD